MIKTKRCTRLAVAE